MKSVQDIAQDLARLEQTHYYSEDFEWLSAVRLYRDSLSPGEQSVLAEVVGRRLMQEGSMTDILLCSVVDVPAAAPHLAAKLNAEELPSQLTRALITALARYRGEEVFQAVARFVDSEQENDALRALASIDFHRALPFLARALHKEHQRDLALHILHDRYKTIRDLDRLAGELRAFSAGWSDPNFIPLLKRALLSKKEPFNPFTEDELDRLQQLLDNA